MYIHSHLSVHINTQIVHVGENDHPFSSDYQFYFLQRGTITITFHEKQETYTLNKQDIILIPPNTDITCSSLHSNTLISVRIDKSYIDSILPLQHELVCNSQKTNNPAYEALAELLLKICSSYYNNETEQSGTIALIYELTILLQQNFTHKMQGDMNMDADFRNIERIRSISEYLHTHYYQSLSLNTLSDAMYLTPQYLSKFIKKNFNATFTSYLTDIRLEHAVSELLHTNHSVTTIALGNGFPNIAAFNRIFRQKYEVSPTTYRQKHTEIAGFSETIEAIPENENLLDELKQVTTIEINADVLSPYQKPWQNTINIGPLSHALKNTFHTNFLEYSRNVPVTYIRFYNMFSEDVLEYDKETNEFNFDNLDVILDFFYRQNVIPFVELSYKPAKGYVSMDSVSAQDIFIQEKELTYYYAALYAVLRHCLNNYGIQYMSKWRFEVWMKYDENLTACESPYQYYKKYMEFYKIIKDLLPKCNVGGPGFHMSGRFQDFMLLVTNLEQYRLPFDFISLYAYSYKLQSPYQNQDFTSLGIVSTDSENIIKNFHTYHSYLKKNNFYNQLPIYITELGSTVSLLNHVTESVYQAAFLCKNMLGLLEHCSCIAYSFFIDTTRNLSLSQKTFSFSGLIAENGIPKPSLHAFSLLNRLGKNLVSLGKNYIMTCNSSNRYQLLCFHYTHFSNTFCFNSWDKIKLEDTYEIFTAESPSNIHLLCNNFPDGRYKVTQFSLNRNYGSVIDKYLRILEHGNISSSELLSTIMSLRADETSYYKQTSIPRQDIYYLNCDSKLELEFSLESHEVVFYEFSRVL
jgi:beta-xylosidase/AraC-like DNA-binding protein